MATEHMFTVKMSGGQEEQDNQARSDLKINHIFIESLMVIIHKALSQKDHACGFNHTI